MIGGWLSDRKNARSIPHKFDRCGYIALRNDSSGDGRWKIGGKNKMIYVRKELSGQEQYKAAAKLKEQADKKEAAAKQKNAEYRTHYNDLDDFEKNGPKKKPSP